MGVLSLFGCEISCFNIKVTLKKPFLKVKKEGLKNTF